MRAACRAVRPRRNAGEAPTLTPMQNKKGCCNGGGAGGETCACPAVPKLRQPPCHASYLLGLGRTDCQLGDLLRLRLQGLASEGCLLRPLARRLESLAERRQALVLDAQALQLLLEAAGCRIEGRRRWGRAQAGPGRDRDARLNVARAKVALGSSVLLPSEACGQPGRLPSRRGTCGRLTGRPNEGWPVDGRPMDRGVRARQTGLHFDRLHA